jgi:type IV fimbrial biogenesis protein FimT
MLNLHFLKPRQTGFALLELITVLMVVSAVLAFVVPPMRDMFMDTRLSIHVNDWLAANRFARAEAIKRGRLVTICRSVGADTGNNRCDTSGVGERVGNDWGVGWLVFVENTTDILGVVDPGEEILFRQGELPEKVYGLASVKKISYNATGEPVGTFAGSNIRFHFDGKLERIICTARTGRSRVLLGRSKCS